MDFKIQVGKKIHLRKFQLGFQTQVEINFQLRHFQLQNVSSWITEREIQPESWGQAVDSDFSTWIYEKVTGFYNWGPLHIFLQQCLCLALKASGKKTKSDESR